MDLGLDTMDLGLDNANSATRTRPRRQELDDTDSTPRTRPLELDNLDSTTWTRQLGLDTTASTTRTGLHHGLGDTDLATLTR